jgi:hypothetical protein
MGDMCITFIYFGLSAERIANLNDADYLSHLFKTFLFL